MVVDDWMSRVDWVAELIASAVNSVLAKLLLWTLLTVYDETKERVEKARSEEVAEFDEPPELIDWSAPPERHQQQTQRRRRWHKPPKPGRANRYPTR